MRNIVWMRLEEVPKSKIIEIRQDSKFSGQVNVTHYKDGNTLYRNDVDWMLQENAWYMAEAPDLREVAHEAVLDYLKFPEFDHTWLSGFFPENNVSPVVLTLVAEKFQEMLDNLAKTL